MENIQNAINQLNLISTGLQIPEIFSDEIEQLKKITKSEELSSEINTIKDIFTSIQNKWNPPITFAYRENFVQAMIQLSNIIQQISNEEIKIPDLEVEKDQTAEKLKKFVNAVYGSIENKLDFFENLKKARCLIPKKDVDLFWNVNALLSDFLNTKTKDIHKKNIIRQNLLFLLAAADKVKYGDFQKLEKSSISLISNKTSEFDIPNLCFDIIHHVYEIMSIVNPRNVKSKEETEKLLLDSYCNPKSINIAEVEYYTYAYAKMDLSNAKIFDSIVKAIRGCFLGQGNVSEINFERGIDVLKSTISEDIQMEPTAKEIPDSFTKCPLELVESSHAINIDKVANQHLYYCESAGLLSFVPSGYNINVVEQPSPESHFKKIDLTNEINLPKIDQGKAQNYIHVPLVGEMMRCISDSRKQPDLKFTQIGNLFNSKYERRDFSKFPKDNSKEMKYFSIEIDDLKIEKESLEFVIGMLYVLDSVKKEPITEPAFFSIQNGKICFLKDVKRVVFEIDDSKNLVLICRLFHNQAYDVVTFVSSIFDAKKSAKPTQSPYNFAVSGLQLYDSKGNFINHNTLPECFHIVQPGTALILDSALLMVLSQTPDFKINVQSKIQTQLLNEKPESDFCYSWPSGKANTLISSSIEFHSATLTPIIEMHNISFSFKKPQKGKYVMFDAYLLEDDNNIKPIQANSNVISYESSDLIYKYTSTIVPFNVRCQFPDIVRFHVDKKLKKTANILIHFFVVEPGKPKEFYKISVIPLYDGKIPLRTSQLELPLFKLTNTNNTKYLSKIKKVSSQSKTSLTIRIPQIYFPHQNFRKLLSSKSSSTLKSIETSDVPKEMLNDNFLFSVSHLIMTISPQNVQCLVSYLSEFNLDDLGPSLDNWIFNYFKPLLFDDLPSNFFKSLFSSLTLLAKVELTYETTLYCLQYLIAAPYFINMAIVIILTCVKKNKSLTDDFLNYIISFIQTFSEFIVLVSSLEKTTKVNQLFSEFLYYVYPLFPENKGLMLIQEHIERLSKLKDFNLESLYPTQTDVKSKHSNLPPPPSIPKPSKTPLSLPIRSLRMIYDFIQIFARTNNFLVSIGYSDPNDIKIFSILISSLTEVTKLDPDFAKQWIITISEFVRTIERSPSVITRCANVMIPYFDFAVSAINNEALIGDYQIFQHFVLPILLMIHSPEKDGLISYFTNLSINDQAQLINFLEKLVTKSLMPTKEEGNKNENEKTYLKEKSKLINFTIFNELTIRIIEFLCCLINKVKFDLSVSAAITSLIASLLNKYQSWDNYKLILLVIVKFIDMQPDKFFFELTEPYKQLIQIALSLVERHLRISRASGVALLIHYFYVDYLTTNNMLVTKQFFMDLYSDILFDIERNILPSYKLLLDRLNLFISSFSFSKQFISLFEERFEAAKIIFDSVTKIRGSNKSPELRVNMMSKIADQFYEYPTLRLKWLQKIVDLSVKEKLMAQASISQAKVSKLIDIMMRKGENNYHIQPLDFSFYSCTNEENNIHLDRTPEEFRHLLTTHPQFCPNGLVDSINLSIQYAKEASFNLSVRQFYFLLIYIYESQRRYLELSSLVHELSTTYNILSSPIDQTTNEYKKPSLYFYLLEKMKDGEIFSKEIYTSAISDLNEYASHLNDIKTKRFEFLGPAFTSSDHEEAIKTTNGICVSSVKPKLTNVLSLETDTFYQDIFYDDHTFKRVIITTELPLPSSFICVNVKDIKVQSYNEEEAFELFINESINKLKEGSECILLHCPTVEIKNRWMKSKPLLAIHPCRKAILEELDSKSNIIKLIFDKFYSKDSVSPQQKELVENWFIEMRNSIQAFKTGIDYESNDSFGADYKQMCHTLSRYYKLLFKKEIIFYEPEIKRDPLQYVSPYESKEECEN